MISYHDVYGGLWVALMLLGVDRFPRDEGVARMLAALSKYSDIIRDDAWAEEFLPKFEPALLGAEDAFKSALAWGHTAGLCRPEDDVVVIEIEEDLYRHALSHHGQDFHRAMLKFAQAFGGDLIAS